MSLLLVLDALRGFRGLPSTAVALAVAGLTAKAALDAADARRLRRRGTTPASARGGASAVARVLVGPSVGAFAVTLAIVAAAFGWTVPLPVTIAAVVLAFAGTVFFLVERLLSPRETDGESDAETGERRKSDGKVALSAGRMAWLGVWTVGQTMGGLFFWSGQAAAVMELAYPHSKDVPLASWLYAIATAVLGISGAAYLARPVGPDPRNVAVRLQLMAGTAFMGLAGLSAVVPTGLPMAVLIVAAVALTGGCCWQQYAVGRTISLARSGNLLANGVYLAAWGGTAYLLSYFIDQKLVDLLGTRGALFAIGAVVFVTSGLARLAPRHPQTGTRGERSAREDWRRAIEARRNPIVREVMILVVLCGVPLAGAYSPFSVAAAHWASEGAFWAAALTGTIGFPLIAVLLLCAGFGPLFERRGTLLQVFGASLITVGYLIAYIPLFDPRWGGFTTGANLVLTEFGANAVLIVPLARVSRLLDERGRAAFAGLCAAKYLPGAPLGLVVVLIQLALGGYAAAWPVTTTICLMAAVALFWRIPRVRAAGIS